MKKTARRLAVLAGLAVTIVGSSVAPSVVATADDGRDRESGPRTVHVSGEQFPVPGTVNYTMAGALVGDWLVNARKPSLHSATTLYAEAGTERFIGCIDSNRDGDCNDRRDRNGEMTTVYLYWASFKADGTTLIKGQCVHPITGGTGAFRGSRGVIHMFDRLVDGEVKTIYRGDIVLNAVDEPPAPPAVPLVQNSALERAAAPAGERSGC
jgi:hypothetical protein